MRAHLFYYTPFHHRLLNEEEIKHIKYKYKRDTNYIHPPNCLFHKDHLQIIIYLIGRNPFRHGHYLIK